MTDQSIEELNIRHFKLRSGDEILALVSNRNKDNWMVEAPLLISENMSGGKQLSHWFPFSTTRVFKLIDFDVMQHSSVVSEIKSAYIKFALRTQQVELIKQNYEILEEYMNSNKSDDDSYYDPINTMDTETIH